MHGETEHAGMMLYRCLLAWAIWLKLIFRWGPPVPDIRHAGPYPLPLYCSRENRGAQALRFAVDRALLGLPDIAPLWPALGARTPHPA